MNYIRGIIALALLNACSVAPPQTTVSVVEVHDAVHFYATHQHEYEDQTAGTHEPLVIPAGSYADNLLKTLPTGTVISEWLPEQGCGIIEYSSESHEFTDFSIRWKPVRYDLFFGLIRFPWNHNPHTLAPGVFLFQASGKAFFLGSIDSPVRNLRPCMRSQGGDCETTSLELLGQSLRVETRIVMENGVAVETVEGGKGDADPVLYCELESDHDAITFSTPIDAIPMFFENVQNASKRSCEPCGLRRPAYPFLPDWAMGGLFGCF